MKQKVGKPWQGTFGGVMRKSFTKYHLTDVLLDVKQEPWRYLLKPSSVDGGKVKACIQVHG